MLATFVSAQVNTWAASHLSIVGDGDPATGPRAAIYVAPFVEEASKATVLFWLAILMRYAWVSRLSGIVLAGLSASLRVRREHPVLRPGLPVRRSQLRPTTPGSAAAALQVAWADDILRASALHRDDRNRSGRGLAIQEQDCQGRRTASRILRSVLPAHGVQHDRLPGQRPEPAVDVSRRGAATGHRHDRLRGPAGAARAN